jgi:hypothetical protein
MAVRVEVVPTPSLLADLTTQLHFPLRQLHDQLHRDDVAGEREGVSRSASGAY